MTTEQIKYLDEAAAARRLNVSRRTMKRWRNEGGGPSYIRIGVRKIGYSESGIDKWTRTNTHASRAAELSKAGGKSA